MKAPQVQLLLRIPEKVLLRVISDYIVESLLIPRTWFLGYTLWILSDNFKIPIVRRKFEIRTEVGCNVNDGFPFLIEDAI
jgi:hypothetical protein